MMGGRSNADEGEEKSAQLLDFDVLSTTQGRLKTREETRIQKDKLYRTR